MLATLIPLFDENMTVKAYSLFTQKKNFLLNPSFLGTGMNDGVGQIQGFELIENMGIETLSGDKEVFISINNISLFTDINEQCKAPHDRVVLLVDNAVLPNDMYINRLKELKNSGYKLAIRKLPVSSFEDYRQVLLLMDYILLRLTGIVLRRKNSRRRCLAAAAVGALFACLNLYVRPGKTGVLTIVLRVVCAVFMIWIAYEIQDVKHMTGAALFFFGMTFLTGGFWMAVSENRRVTAAFFLSCAAVTYGGLSLMICLMEQIKESREHIYPVALKYHGQLQETYGLYDTGNRLCDTVTGAPVSVADPEILRSLLSEELTDRLLHLKERPEEIESTEIADLKPHYLSFQTVGREVQLILAVTLEDLCIQIPGERIHVSGPVFALSSEPFALGKEYKVILNSRLLH